MIPPVAETKGIISNGWMTLNNELERMLKEVVVA
jgi:hypothetical protein